MSRPTYIDIDLGALSHNARLARSLAGPAQLMAAVKADAYGHGLVPCAQTLAPMVDGLAVAITEEGIALREAGVTAPILVLEGPFDKDDVQAIVAHDLWSVVHQAHQLSLLCEVDARRTTQVWIKVDTGMHRLGLPVDTVDTVFADVEAAGFKRPVVMSHLGFAEDPKSALSHRQLARWSEISEGTQTSNSLMNSAALLGRVNGDSDWVRPGYMLYGGRPGDRFAQLPLQPVMTFRSKVMALREIAAGESVGYGGRWIASRASQIATIPVGYGDGYPRTATDGTPVLIDGIRCPLVGRVSMDMITIDVTDHPHCLIGAPVVLWGQGLAVDEVATHADTIGYELMTRLPSRAPRHWQQAN